MIQIQSTGKLLDYKDFRQYSNIFCETGNAAGDGIQRALEAGFSRILGAEASESYFNICKERFIGQQNVVLCNDKSTNCLNAFLGNNIFSQYIDKKAVFFLDAHVSGDTSAGYQDWIDKGEESDYAQDKTIKAELKIILENNNKHVIIIDDVNGLSDGHANEYAEIMAKANPNYKFFFYDENLSGDPEFYYKDKILVAIP